MGIKNMLQTQGSPFAAEKNGGAILPNPLEFDSKNNNKPVDKRINKNEFAKIDKNKNLIENGILKFHFYAIFKTAFRKILEDEKNKNYELPTCIKIKKN